MSDGGEVAIRTMSAAAKRDGVDIRTGHRVQRVIRNAAGEVIGVEADTAKGKKRFFARKAVVFCTGGFTHDVELRKNYLSAPVYGGCAARSNEGDFIYIAGAVGAQLRNMNYAWMCPIVFEKAMARDPESDRHIFAVRQLDDLCEQGGTPRRQRKTGLQRNGSSFFPVGWRPVRVSKSLADRHLGSAQPGSQRRRRVWPLHRSPGHGRCPCHQGRDAGRFEQSNRRTLGALQGGHRRAHARCRLRKSSGGDDCSASTALRPAAGISTSSVASVRSNCCSTVRWRRHRRRRIRPCSRSPKRVRTMRRF